MISARTEDAGLGAKGKGLVEVDLHSQESSPLEECIRRQLDTWDQASRGEGGLFDITMIVFGVTVELDLAYFLHRELA